MGPRLRQGIWPTNDEAHREVVVEDRDKPIERPPTDVERINEFGHGAQDALAGPGQDAYFNGEGDLILVVNTSWWDCLGPNEKRVASVE